MKGRIEVDVLKQIESMSTEKVTETLTLLKEINDTFQFFDNIIHSDLHSEKEQTILQIQECSKVIEICQKLLNECSPDYPGRILSNRQEFLYPYFLKTLEIMLYINNNQYYYKNNEIIQSLFQKLVDEFKPILEVIAQSQTYPNPDRLYRRTDAQKELIKEKRTYTFTDTIAEVIIYNLILINKIVNENFDTKEKGEIQAGQLTRNRLYQLLQNCRYTFSENSLFNIRKDDQGNEIPSYEKNRTEGLLVVLNYILNNTSDDHILRTSMIDYFKKMSLPQDINAKILLSKKFGDENGVIKNSHPQTEFSLKNIQYLPVKGLMEQPSRSSKNLQDAIEHIIDNLPYKNKSSAYYDENNNLILSIYDGKNCTNINVSELLINKPEIYKINLSDDRRLNFSTAVTGCSLYLIEHDDLLEKLNTPGYFKNEGKLKNVCLVSFEKRNDQIKKIKSVHYFNIKSKSIDFTDRCKNLKIKNIINKNNGLKILNKNEENYYPVTPSELESLSEPKQAIDVILSDLHELFAKEKILFLKPIFAARPFPQALNKVSESVLPSDEAISIYLYTMSYYVLMQHLLIYCGTKRFPKKFSNELFLAKYLKMFGDFTTNANALYQLVIEIILHFCSASKGIFNLLKENQEKVLEAISQDEVNNCELFIIDNYSNLVKCVAASKKNSLILIVNRSIVPDTESIKDIKIYKVKDKKIVKKIMDVDLVISATPVELFEKLGEKDILNRLLSLPREENGLVSSETAFVRSYIKRILGLCELNTFDKGEIYFRAETDNEFTLAKLDLFINGILNRGFCISPWYNFASTSMGVVKIFLAEGYKILFKIHMPNGYASVIENISDVPEELEALLAPLQFPICYRIRMGSAGNLIFDCFPVPVEFSTQYNKLFNDCLQNELEVKEKLNSFQLKHINTKLAAEFKKLVINNQEKEGIARYFENEFSTSIQKSCFIGTPIWAICKTKDFVDPDSMVKQLATYSQENLIRNTYFFIFSNDFAEIFLFYIDVKNMLHSIKVDLTKELMEELKVDLSKINDVEKANLATPQGIKPKHFFNPLSLFQANTISLLSQQITSLNPTLFPHIVGLIKQDTVKQQKSSRRSSLGKSAGKLFSNQNDLHSLRVTHSPRAIFLDDEHFRDLDKLLNDKKEIEENLDFCKRQRTQHSGFQNLSNKALQLKFKKNIFDISLPMIKSSIDTIYRIIPSESHHKEVGKINIQIKTILPELNTTENIKKKFKEVDDIVINILLIKDLTLKHHIDLIIFLHLAKTLYSFSLGQSKLLITERMRLNSLTNEFTLWHINHDLEEKKLPTIQSMTDNPFMLFEICCGEDLKGYQEFQSMHFPLLDSFIAEINRGKAQPTSYKSQLATSYKTQLEDCKSHLMQTIQVYNKMHFDPKSNQIYFNLLERSLVWFAMVAKQYDIEHINIKLKHLNREKSKSPRRTNQLFLEPTTPKGIRSRGRSTNLQQLFVPPSKPSRSKSTSAGKTSLGVNKTPNNTL